MPGQLEYLISSLPYLPFGQTKEVRDKITTTFKKYAGAAETEKELIELFELEATKFLSPGAARTLRALDLEEMHHARFRESKNKVIATFAQYLYGLKVAVLKQRIPRRQFQKEWSQLEIPPFELAEGTPLEKEVQLMQLQWQKLETLASGHHFDLEALIIYKIKLMILDRWWQFNEEKGFRRFNQVIQDVYYGR